MSFTLFPHWQQSNWGQNGNGRSSHFIDESPLLIPLTDSEGFTALEGAVNALR